MQCYAKNKNKGLAALFCLLWLGCLGLATTGYAQLRPEAKASVIRNFARVSFTHTEPLKLRSAVKGRQIRLRFDKPVLVNSVPLLSKLKPYVISISQSQDKRSLLLTTNREYRTRSFVSGKSSGIDIIGLQKGGTQEVVKESPKLPEKKKPTPKEDTAKAPFKVRPALKPKVPAKEVVEPPKEEKPEEKTLPLAKPEIELPKVEESKEPPAPLPEEPVVEKVEETPITPAVEPAIKEEAEKPTEPEAVKPVPEEEVVEVEPEPVQPAAPVAAVEVEQSEETSQPEPISSHAIKVETLEEGIALTFPWDRRVAATVFRRDGRTIILFNEQKTFDTSQLQAHPKVEAVSSVKITAHSPAQIWVLETPLEGIEVSRQEKSYHWRITLLEDEVLPDKLLKTLPKVEPPLKPHLFVPVLELAQPVKFLDPLIGDKLTAVPFYEAGAGLVPPRRFAEFAMLRTAQGIILSDAIPELRVARTRNGLKITSPEGILISQDLPPVQLPEPDIEESEASDSFFPYQNWQAPLDEPTAADFENRLWRQASTLDKKKKRVARKRLAELYLSQGRAIEAKTILQLLAKESPIYFMRNKLHAMLGAAHFLAYEFLAAETAFKHATIEKEPELDFWREILNVLLRGGGEADYQAYYDKYIRHYPPVMRQRLALVAADHFINKRQYNKGLKVFDTLHKDAMLEDMQDHVQFLIGRVLAGTTQKNAARTLWQRLANKTDNRYIRPRALFALTNLNLAENKTSIEEAINTLEPIRIIWRGDRFEISLLTLLTRLYEEVGKHREALRAYREIITYFPNYPKNIEITGKMADIFRELFNEGGADDMPALQALALYYEFRNLTPIGREGDKMIQNLADRLTEVELLDRASALLQHQVEYRLSGEERSRVGARLALINLLRRKPREALDVLELTGFGGNPGSLQQQRTLLTARALMGLGESKRALALLDGDKTREAELLKLAIHWKERKWPKVIEVAEVLMGQREDPSLPLEAGEADVLMKLAIAYVFEQQKGQLQYLRDYFLPLVEGEQERNLFSFITEDTPLDYRNIAKLTAQIGRMESFLASYRDKIKKGGVSKAVE